ncbi:MAG: hypothetical protein ACXVAS_14270 [Vulcanimicrobiaceae bacterium]
MGETSDVVRARTRAPFIVWFTLAAITALVAPAALENWRVNGDIPWQRWLGEQILRTHHLPAYLGSETLSAPGSPWIPQEWLLGTMLALTERHHAFVLLAIAAVLAVVATMLIGMRRARLRGASAPIYYALCVVLIGLSTLESFGIRAQVFAWPLFALLLLIYDSEGTCAWWAVPLTVLWANVHASAMLAPAVTLLYAFGAALEDRAWTPRVARYVALVPLTALAICANPLGWKLPAYAIWLVRSPIRAFISEWQPLSIGDFTFLVTTLPLCIGLVILTWRRRVRWSDGLVAIACGCLEIGARRNIPLFAIAVAPVVCAGLAQLFPAAAAARESRNERALQIAAAALLLPAIFAVTHNQQPRHWTSIVPFEAMDRIAAMPGTQRLFCYDFAACGLALGHANIRTFMDGRCDPFPWHVWQQYRKVVQVRSGWQGVLDGYAITLVLTPDGELFTRSMETDSNWRRIYDKNGFSIFARRELGRAGTAHARSLRRAPGGGRAAHEALVHHGYPQIARTTDQPSQSQPR